MDIKKEFIEYYKNNLNLTNPEFINFLEVINTPLPMTFRILDKTLCHLIDSFQLAKKVDLFDDVYECEREAYKDSKLRDTIIKFTNINKVYRQEIASMLPVCFLNVLESDYVLDMCAAPGSKSIQILEKIKTGLLISNDCNIKRCDILRSNIKQLCNPNGIITNHDSRIYPNIYLNEKEKLKFNKILCDVPCSGDGTCRKNKDIKIRWNKNNAIGLMTTQFEILRRGLNMLKEDGLLIYSTCSFNPLENECIIQRAIIECDCEIISIPPPSGFIIREGLAKWDPMIVGQTEKNKWYFPIEEDIGLSKCMRIYPQDQNTGGFFIAALKLKGKKSNIGYKPHDLNRNTDKNVLYKSLKGDYTFYCVDQNINRIIENQFNISINNSLISQSINNRHVSIVSNLAYKILEINPQIFIIAAGYIAFTKIGFTFVNEVLYRPKPNVLKQFIHDKNQIIPVKTEDALKLLNAEFIDNELLSLKIKDAGCYIVKFEGSNDYHCLWRGPNKSGVMINSNYKIAIKDIINFAIICKKRDFLC